VILSWNASVPSVRRKEDAVGYCFYRSRKKNVANKNAKREFTCTGCEQINFIPITRTGCVDDLVQDGAAYYYVATAINHDGKLSTASNEAHADIPPGPQSINPGAGGSYSLCREQAGSK
jgi:hypothetical protein